MRSRPLSDSLKRCFQPRQIGGNIVFVRFRGLRHAKNFVTIRVMHPTRLRCRVNSASKPAQMPQNFAPCVIIHSLAHAEAVLRHGHQCTLLSAGGAALVGGVGWWQALITQARQRVPATACTDILDCADAPGLAMAALRMGQIGLILNPNSPGFGAVAKAAMAQGARLLPYAPAALDMAHRRDRHGLAAYLNAEAQQLVTSGDRDTPHTLR
jgi:hypothetical protein